MRGKVLASVLLFATRVFAGECQTTVIITDATARPMFETRVALFDQTCRYPETATQGPCSVVTHDDGSAQFRVVMESESSTEIAVNIVIDERVMNRVVSTTLTCDDTTQISLEGVYRSGRGIVVVRHALNAEGCGNVLLVHGMHVAPSDRCGYNGGARTWCGMANMFADAGYGVAEYIYPTEGRVQISAVRLASTLARVEKMTGYGEWFVLAHSFGGLVVRECATTDASCLARIRTLVTLGTPHVGISEWCATFACKPRQQLQFGNAYLRDIERRPFLDIPVTTVAGSVYDAVRCTNDDALSDGIVYAWSANPQAFAIWYNQQIVPLDHSALACARSPLHEAFRVAEDAFSALSGCMLACTPKERACGKGNACCWDGYDNDCDGKRDFSDVECFDIDPEEF